MMHKALRAVPGPERQHEVLTMSQTLDVRQCDRFDPDDFNARWIEKYLNIILIGLIAS